MATSSQEPKARRQREGAPTLHTEEEEDATEVSEARSQWAPWVDNTHAREPAGRKTRELERQGSVCPVIAVRRSVLECREALGTLVKSHGAQDSVGCPRGESRGASRERTRYGCTQYHAGGRSWSDASRALPTGRSQGLVVENPSRALAGRKHEAPPDAGHELREGETVRGIALTIKSTRWFGLWVSARRFSIQRKMFSG